jgi:hypothetical protein
MKKNSSSNQFVTSNNNEPNNLLAQQETKSQAAPAPQQTQSNKKKNKKNKENNNSQNTNSANQQSNVALRQHQEEIIVESVTEPVAVLKSDVKHLEDALIDNDNENFSSSPAILAKNLVTKLGPKTATTVTTKPLQVSDTNLEEVDLKASIKISNNNNNNIKNSNNSSSGVSSSNEEDENDEDLIATKTVVKKKPSLVPQTNTPVPLFGSQIHYSPIQSAPIIQPVHPFMNQNQRNPTTNTTTTTSTNVNINKQVLSSSDANNNNSNNTNKNYDKMMSNHNHNDNYSSSPSVNSSINNNNISIESFGHFLNENHNFASLNHIQDTNSLLIDKQAMLEPQDLDNNSLLQRLISDEIKAYLILDDNELLQYKSAQEFIALFRTNYPVNGAASNLNSPNKPNQHHTSEISLNSSSSFSSSPTSSATTPSPHQQPPLNDDKLVKCVSIFGNTGDGKSHSLNHTFFNGRPIFRTSNKQETCTMGVWCAYDSVTNSLIFDTEGLLGTTGNENKRMRLLLKVLAISDIIIYRTRAERLHNDLFKFLSDASVAYLKYFSKELKAAAQKLKLDTISSLGPDCVIFHETQHTDILTDEYDIDGHMRTVAHQLRDRFAKLDLSYNAFSSIEYVGTRTSFMNQHQNSNVILNNMMVMKNGTTNARMLVSTDFTKLAHTVRNLLRNNSVRPPRKLSSIYTVFKVLNDKFNGVINKNQISTFADEYFTCSGLC